MILPNERPPSAPYGYCDRKCCEGRKTPLEVRTLPYLVDKDGRLIPLLWCPTCEPREMKHGIIKGVRA